MSPDRPAAADGKGATSNRPDANRRGTPVGMQPRLLCLRRRVAAPTGTPQRRPGRRGRTPFRCRPRSSPSTAAPVQGGPGRTRSRQPKPHLTLPLLSAVSSHSHPSLDSHPQRAKERERKRETGNGANNNDAKKTRLFVWLRNSDASERRAAASARARCSARTNDHLQPQSYGDAPTGGRLSGGSTRLRHRQRSAGGTGVPWWVATPK